jgi:hypothetical protein
MSSSRRIDDIVLLDLLSQRHAIAQHLAEVDDDAKLEWLRQRGELTQIQITVPAPPTYRFRSSVGLEAAFFLRDGQFVFLGDHTTIR